ncbi:transposase and inactivated derivatives-like protein [Microseira wollei NIES-4236]|uniref:Transposase and inactivated derivatives-like protein n=1 Tax=Microseira wollei NIES-4236 TaxID=2530354 RepID=A0AAV3XLH0_9CYAN|nr:transposase and inactivated derivatives-like protein [Microseira wollei NIES-4236]
MNRGDESNEQWERLKPLLPPQKPKTGKPNHDRRQVVNGILWILRTGAPRRDLPERYGKWDGPFNREIYRQRNIVERAINRLKQKITGYTVHLVVPEVDSGPILIQAAVPVLPDDTPETLHARIQVQEHKIMVEAIRYATALPNPLAARQCQEK